MDLEAILRKWLAMGGADKIKGRVATNHAGELRLYLMTYSGDPPTPSGTLTLAVTGNTATLVGE